MSFVGGGSDLPSYYRQKGGAVLSTSVDKYMYVTVNKKFDSEIRLSYSVTENESNVQRIKHPIVRNMLNFLGIEGGIEITSISDIPSRFSIGKGIWIIVYMPIAFIFKLKLIIICINQKFFWKFYT